MRSDQRSERRRAAYRAGRLAETLCVWLLRLKGYRVLARDWRVPVGEIDILARRGSVLAAVEVKRRGRLSDAAEAIGPRQRRRILRALEAFVARNPALGRLTLRFDVMLVAPRAPPRHIRDAWRP
jgi:putative endonuclease